MLSSDALRLIHALYHEYRYPGFILSFSDQDLHDALEYLEDQDLERTLPRRTMIRKEMQRRTREKRMEDKQKANRPPVKIEFMDDWNQTCVELRRRLGYDNSL
jgi:hypothetical protein